MNSIKQGTFILLIALLPLFVAPAVFAIDTPTEHIDEIQFSEAELAQILAPIALYPDSLLTHILIASTYPLEVVQANRWREQHKDLQASEAVNQAEDKDWDPSVVALVAFPTVLEKLSEDLNWTQKLGDAFLQDEQQVLSSIQMLRRQADDANSLDDMDNMRVTKVNQEIIIEPARKEIVYVPVYDTRVVYGHWRWYNYPPVYWVYPPRYAIGYPNHISSHFYWHSGIQISFNYYFSAFHWHNRHIVVTHHRHSNHYRPRTRIVSSSGAQRWAHKPQHRRGVAYRSTVVKQRYNSHRPSTLQTKQLRSAERYGNAAKPKHYSTTQVKQKREQGFRHKLANSHANADRNIKANQRPEFKSSYKRDSAQRQINSSATTYKSDGNKQSRNSAYRVESPKTKPVVGQDRTHQRNKSIQRHKGVQRELSPQRNNNTQRDKRAQPKTQYRAQANHQASRERSKYSSQGRTKQREH
ncbi:DUF3300 domain-containing protein [Shewanella psychrotolerans]|uniref:DUF3300 domain-containing protein n=1 Tax=Shewanella psychrotolerans TaxID=2864206 RepID=UPI001C654AC1|nr:DUF3300 domain-containing protein [Shewanella psychrotolerans]QYK00387.1 DUF3300 domain-containing protein [Shewanella psychrotolerans]